MVVAKQKARFKLFMAVWTSDIDQVSLTLLAVCENVTVFVLVSANRANPVNVHGVDEFSAKWTWRFDRHSAIILGC